MLIDLSKAFDCLPHPLLLAKLRAYGMSKDACNLVMSYLSNRRQLVKIGDCRSSWLNVSKGVPQGSIMGPLLFNIFINDMFFTMSNIYNYADDNTLSEVGSDITEVTDRLQSSTIDLLKWFRANGMQANPNKFQLMFLGNKQIDDNISVKIEDCDITASKSVKLLGVVVDDKLKFDDHISLICKKAAFQLNSLRRLTNVLGIKTKAVLFNSFIASNFNYCPLVWFHCNNKCILKMEKIQERGLRIIFNDYASTYSELLSSANKDFLYVSRMKKLALLVYKCINGCAPDILNGMFLTKDTGHVLRSHSSALKHKVNTHSYGLSSLRYSGSSLWNKMPAEFKQCMDECTFRTLLKSWSGPDCRCGFCVLCTVKLR